MAWPPKIGEPLPRGEDAYNVHEKLRDYSLNLAHDVGGHKAAGFLQVLGISSEDVEYLAATLHDGARELPVTAVRDNAPFGLKCNVIVPVRGRGERADRIANVLTSWELRHEDDSPRLITAYIDE